MQNAGSERTLKHGYLRLQATGYSHKGTVGTVPYMNRQKSASKSILDFFPIMEMIRSPGAVGRSMGPVGEVVLHNLYDVSGYPGPHLRPTAP